MTNALEVKRQKICGIPTTSGGLKTVVVDDDKDNLLKNVYKRLE